MIKFSSTTFFSLFFDPQYDSLLGDNDITIHINSRVAKCHGYGGYIRVKTLEGWGKKSERIHSFAKSSMILGKFEQLKGYSIFNPGLYDEIYGFVPQK